MFSTAVLRDVKIKALRRRVWFKLSLEERSIIDLAIKYVRKVKSRVLNNVLTKIVIKILNLVEDILPGVMEVGFEVARGYVGQALRWGYVNALSWLRDEAYILHLGISYICMRKLKDPQVGFWWFIISE
jgi:hypothetical protein